MKIAVISDTHGNYPLALRACEEVEPLDAVIHLGDGADDVRILEQVVACRIISVAGNCDLGSTASRELLWEESGRRMLLVHGDRYGVKSGLARLEQRALQLGVDAVLFGHSHCGQIITHSGVLFVNPGTLMKSDTPTTYAILEISGTNIDACLMSIA